MPKLFEDVRPRPRGRLTRWASAYAWFFAVGSLVALTLMLVIRADTINSGSGGIFCWNTSDGGRHTGWLMDYSGQSGYLTAAIETGVVLFAIIGSCLRRDTVRHASLLALLAWSVLWPLGAARMMLAMQTWDTLAYTALSMLAVVACYIRARDRWTLPSVDEVRPVRRTRPMTA